MKKLVRIMIVFTLFGVLSCSTTRVRANSGPPVIGVSITVEQCEEIYDEILEYYVPDFTGHIDILVKTSDFEEDDFIEMSDHYKTMYPFYEDIDYLNNIDDGWTSFSAYYKDDHKWGLDNYHCGIQFGDHKEVEQISVLKIVYFDDTGNTLFISDEIEVPSVLFYQVRDAVIHFDIETYEIEDYLHPRTNPYLFLGILFIGFLMLYSVVIEFISAFVFRLRKKHMLLHILIINIITQALMYYYFLVVFDGFESSYSLHLLVTEIIIIVVEFIYLYSFLKEDVSIKRLAFYVVFANILSYLLGIIRYY